MQNQLQKAIDLARKTGDRIIIFDSARPDDTYVVMSLDEYEKLIVARSEVRGLTEEELIDKINRDIAIWKSENESDGFSESFDVDADVKNAKKEAAKQAKDREDFYFGGFKSLGEGISRKREKIKSSSWAIPSERRMTDEEVIEEDKQYLEEINF